MGAADYARVLAEMRLANGQLFPIPLTLPVRDDERVELDSDVALLDSKNETLAVMTVEEIYEWDLESTAREVFGTTDARHPPVAIPVANQRSRQLRCRNMRLNPVHVFVAILFRQINKLAKWQHAHADLIFVLLDQFLRGVRWIERFSS